MDAGNMNGLRCWNANKRDFEAQKYISIFRIIFESSSFCLFVCLLENLDPMEPF